MISRKTKMVRKAAIKRKTTLRKKKRGGIDVELDKLCRQIVLARDGFRCRWCLKDAAGHSKAVVLHVHHIRPKGSSPALRFELENLILLCAGCHLFKAHGRDSIATAAWYVRELGQPLLDKLAMLAQVRKGKKTDKQAVKLYLLGVLQGIYERIAAGTA